MPLKSERLVCYGKMPHSIHIAGYITQSSTYDFPSLNLHIIIRS